MCTIEKFYDVSSLGYLLINDLYGVFNIIKRSGNKIVNTCIQEGNNYHTNILYDKYFLEEFEEHRWRNLFSNRKAIFSKEKSFKLLFSEIQMK